jgi:hypothetical protein
VRYYQDAIRPELPWVCAALVAVMAIYGVVNTHNTFAVDRGRVALANELLAAGVPDTAVDNGWEYNQGVELEHAGFINDYRMINPEGMYKPAPPLPEGTCEVNGHDLTPHIVPRYGISFDPMHAMDWRRSRRCSIRDGWDGAGDAVRGVLHKP